MFEASHLQHQLVSGYIQIVSDGYSLPAFWSHPEVGGPFPGLVLLHDYWGLTPHIRAQVRRFAEQGYYVIAPDLFDGLVADTVPQAQALVQHIGETMRPRVTAALRALKTHHRCNGKIGLVGWGIGGRLALQTAVLRDDLRALVTFYGQPDSTLAELRLLNCPFLAIFAEQDADIPPEAVERLRQMLGEVGAAHEVIAYPEAERGFFDDSRPDFHAAAAQDAWNRTMDFLNQHLDVPQATEQGPVY
jgi:carboxymethylenebutenolidase